MEPPLPPPPQTRGERVFRRVYVFLAVLTLFYAVLHTITKVPGFVVAPLTIVAWKFVYQGVKQTWDDPDNRVLRKWSMALMIVAFLVILASMLLFMN